MFQWPSLSSLFNIIKELKEYQEIDKSKKYTEDVAHGFWELYHLAITFHGRYKLSNIVKAATEGDIDLDPAVFSLYRFLLIAIPPQVIAVVVSQN